MPINTSDLTTKVLDGSGVFDELMSATTSHIEAQYLKQRITGSDYANVYIASIQSAMQQSVAFLLGKDTAAAQANLIEAQTISQGKQDLISDLQLIAMQEDIDLKHAQHLEVLDGTLRANTQLDDSLLTSSKQREGITQDNLVKVQQVLESVFKVEDLLPAELLDLQKRTDVAEREISEKELTGNVQRADIQESTDLKHAQHLSVVTETLNIPKQGALIDAQALLTGKQVSIAEKEITIKEQDLLIKEQELVIRTAEGLNIPLEGLLLTEKIESEALNNKEDGMLQNQIAKIKADVSVAHEEVEIAKTKTATEQANSIANIDKVLGYNYTLDSEGNIVVGTDTGDGKLDFDKELVKGQVEAIQQSTLNALSENRNIIATGTKLDQEVLLVQQTVSKAIKEEDLIDKTILKAAEEILILKEDILMTREQIDKLQAEELNIPKQGRLIDAQTAKLLSEDDLVAQQLLKLIAEEALLNKQLTKLVVDITNAGKEGNVLDKQVVKLTEEADLLDRKRASEAAQTADTVDGQPVGGVIGKQKDLYIAQTEGFARDAEQKMAKIMVDSWNVRKSVDANTEADRAALGDYQIASVVSKAAEGIDTVISASTPPT